MSSSAWNWVNLFLARLSLRIYGTVARALNKRAGSTKVESDEKLLALKFNSYTLAKHDKSAGRVQRPFWAKFKIYKDGKCPSWGMWPGGTLLYAKWRVCKLGKKLVIPVIPTALNWIESISLYYKSNSSRETKLTSWWRLTWFSDRSMY